MILNKKKSPNFSGTVAKSVIPAKAGIPFRLLKLSTGPFRPIKSFWDGTSIINFIGWYRDTVHGFPIKTFGNDGIHQHPPPLLIVFVFLFFIAGCGVSTRTARISKKPLVIKPPEFEKLKSVKLPEKVKIGLKVGLSEVTISCRGGLVVRESDKKIAQGWPAGDYKFTVKDGNIFEGGVRRARRLRLSPRDEGSFVEVKGKPYRGDILIVGDGENITVINELGVDDYLMGVLPRECGALWALESLKAQAVASRTYLVSHLGQHSQQGFDLCSDVHCQVYGGVLKEHPNTNQAVEETKGEILIFKGKPIKAFFHSNCGGSTEESQYVWQVESQPYLARKKCRFGTGDPRYHWRKMIANSDILKALKGGKIKVPGSELYSIKVLEKSPSSRARKLAVKTDAGTFIMSGNDFRIALDPEIIRSTLWTNLKKKNNAYFFEGRGWGHGVGMCQWGAKGQAEAGRDYRAILNFYYPHTEIEIW